MLKVGVIGAGSMGRNHVRIYAGMAGCELLGVADPDGSRRELADEYSTSYFADHAGLLALGPDLVSIAAPTTLHAAIARDAISAGCHLLIEKPVADDVGAALEVLKLAEAKGLMVAVGHIERFNPSVVKLKGLIDSGELGEVLTVNNLRAQPYHGRILDTGIILDLATHDVDLQAWLLGERAERVFTVAMKRVHNHEDHATLLLSCPSGRSGVIELSWNAPYRERYIQVFGTKRMAVADLIGQQVTVFDENPDGHPPLPRSIPVTRVEPLATELADVVDAVNNGTPPRCTAADSVYALRVCLAAEKSHETKQVETIEGA